MTDSEIMTLKFLIHLMLMTAALNSFALDQFRSNEGEWSVDADSIDADTLEYGKEQFKDLTNWKNINPDRWTDLSIWKRQRAIKDETQNWRVLVRNKRESEPIGKVIKCVGSCRYFKGIYSSPASHLSNLKEGDEFQTEADSSAWLVLFDGTLLRVSPNTSLTFNEMNISKDEIFFLIRVNYGHLQFQSRLRGKFSIINKAQSDMGFLPLMIKEANREFYSIKEYEKFNSREKIQYSIVPHAGHFSQYEALNSEISDSSHFTQKRNSKIFFYTPNLTLISENMNGSIFYQINSETIFEVSKKIPHFNSVDSREQSATYQLRGYETRGMIDVPEDRWLITSRDGQSIQEALTDLNHLNAAKGFVERIPSIHLAREIFIDNYFLSSLDPSLNQNQLARDHGIRLWNSGARPEMFLRETYLREYIRRTETTNLKSIAKVFSEGEATSFDIDYISFMMERHYRKIRTLHTASHLAVREMNENEYYLWLLRNDKK